MTEEKIGVVVTTEHKGVFFGYTTLAALKKANSILTLERARMCLYWSAETKGIMGLASNGPAPGSRVTPAVPSLKLNGITSISEVAPNAIQKWEDQPW